MDVTVSSAAQIVVAGTSAAEIAEVETLANVAVETTATVVGTVAVEITAETANTTMTAAIGSTITNVVGIVEVVVTVVRGVAEENDVITTTIAATTSGVATISGAPIRITKEDAEIRSSLPTTFVTPAPLPLLHSFIRLFELSIFKCGIY